MEPRQEKNTIRRQLLNDCSKFASRMRLKYIFHGNDKEPHLFLVKSDWDPPVQLSVALGTFLEEVNFELAINIKLNKPKDNLSQGERNALNYRVTRTNIALRKANIKGATTVIIMNRTDKLNRRRVQLHHMLNYRPLDKPMVDTTAKKVHRLIRSVIQEGHIDKMTA